VCPHLERAARHTEHARYVFWIASLDVSKHQDGTVMNRRVGERTVNECLQFTTVYERLDARCIIRDSIVDEHLGRPAATSAKTHERGVHHDAV
jgi:hypothetical protein